MKTKVKISAILILISLVLVYFLHTNEFNSVKTIAIQPLGNISNEEPILKLKNDIEIFYNKKVVILPSIPLSSNYIDVNKGIRYDAERIIRELSSQKSEVYGRVIGYTEEDIFMYRSVTKKSEFETMELLDAWGIFGLGNKPGKACVVSTYRLQDKSESLMYKRLEIVALHELGHTFGLNHCDEKGCIMKGNYLNVNEIEESTGAFCSKCNAKK